MSIADIQDSASVALRRAAAVQALPDASTAFSFVASGVDSTTSAEHGTIFQGPER
jgi:hypothetical protein